jgi:hypothetical protein
VRSVRSPIRRAWAPIVAVALVAAGTMALTVPGHAQAAEPFGVEVFQNAISADSGGTPAVQAGSHPYAMTTTISFNHHGEGEFAFPDGGSVKNLDVNLPRGVVVNPTATETRCTESELEAEYNQGQPHGGCPDSSAVGVVVVVVNGLGERRNAVFNMVTPPDVPGELGFNVAGLGAVVHVIGSVRTGQDYGVSAEAANTSEKLKLSFAKLTLWGSPSDPSHDKERGFCATSLKAGEESYELIKREERELEEEINGLREREPNRRYFCAVERTNRALLTLPGSCTGEPLVTTMRVDSWQETAYLPLVAASSPAVSGCNSLDFSPSLDVRATSSEASSPTGLDVDLRIPQDEDPEGLAEANLKKAIVTLPAGMAVSPSAANGLGACTPQEIGLSNASAPSCPDSSKVGEAEIVTPLLEQPLKGSVYLAQQGNNPFGSLLALYLVAEGSGTLIKLAGHVEADPVTGQLTTTFDSNPQLPFDDLKLRFFGGPRAALVTPSSCGTYTTTSKLTPWSGIAPAEPPSSFTISTGCNGDGFGPSFAAGTSNNQAGAFSPFSVTLSRHDGEQRLGGVQVTTAPGLLGVLKSVVQCPEPQASQGACGPESLIGETTVAAGPGEDPFWVKGGRVYLTGPYKGAPFGLSIVVPAVAGPFNLGDVIVRAAISINPDTAQITVTSDPLPTILQGIPLDLRTVNVTVDRPGFIFNPTNCSSLAVGGAIASTDGANAGVSSRFQAANCANLLFKPTFTVSTFGKASKANGASLDVKVAANGGPQPAGGGEANIRSVKVALPKQLPSRLTTLQKACLAAVFEANPASCPKDSDVGTATAKTPVLTNPLTGPAYLVSHGGAAFPDLEIVLQGEGIKLVLDGHTDIKHGITTSTFNTVPDAPISSFELKLPTGPFSVLGAYVAGSNHYKLCGQSLTLPTTITAQNGAVITQTTKLGVTGCPPTRAQKLAAALKVCHKQAKGKRVGCEKQARRKYGPLKKK